MKDHRVLSKKQEKAAEDELYKALLGLSSVDECRNFFTDLCTPAELQAMKDRWVVVELLGENKTYRQIHDLTGVSITTVGRVARCLGNGAGGYATALKKINNNG
jgi:TrpR-related protein YerC/YecD